MDGYLTPCGRLQHVNLENVIDSGGFDQAWNGEKAIKWRKSQLEGNYGIYCQRECSMKNTCAKANPKKLDELSEFLVNLMNQTKLLTHKYN